MTPAEGGVCPRVAARGRPEGRCYSRPPSTMAQQAPLYDLTLLLSTNAPDEERSRILSEVEAAISNGGGSVERNQDWGTRPMTYRIAHQSDAEYHLLQFTGPPSLLESLNHSLRIADGVL